MRLYFLVFLFPLLAAATTPAFRDMDSLDAPPSYRWQSKDGPIQSLTHVCEPYQGHDTEVFAFYASPATLAGTQTPRSECRAHRRHRHRLGGYTPCIVASVDHRFKAAVPVYGCGFLHEGESVQKPSIDRLRPSREKWMESDDPSRDRPNCRTLILFVNGSNDPHFPLDIYQKSFGCLTGASKQMRVTVKISHHHPPG